MWVYRMYSCAQVHDAMTSLIGLAHRTSEQHVENTSACRKQDLDDMAVVFNWLSKHNPFDPSQPELQLLPSGMTASQGDDINCDTIDEIGQSVHKTYRNAHFDIQESQREPNTIFVLDGGALLHPVKRLPKVTYKNVVAQYLGYVKNKFGPSSIVFDGYNAGPSIKNHEHQR